MGVPVITRCDSTPILEPPKTVFDLVALFVEGLIVVMLDFAVLFRRNAGSMLISIKALRNQSLS